MLFYLHYKRLTKCNRCGFKTPSKEANCNYCFGLSDAETTQMLQEHSESFKGNPSLIKGAYLVFTCILLVLIIVTLIK